METNIKMAVVNDNNSNDNNDDYFYNFVYDCIKIQLFYYLLK